MPNDIDLPGQLPKGVRLPSAGRVLSNVALPVGAAALSQDPIDIATMFARARNILPIGLAAYTPEVNAQEAEWIAQRRAEREMQEAQQAQQREMTPQQRRREFEWQHPGQLERQLILEYLRRQQEKEALESRRPQPEVSARHEARAIEPRRKADGGSVTQSPGAVNPQQIEGAKEFADAVLAKFAGGGKVKALKAVAGVGKQALTESPAALAAVRQPLDPFIAQDNLAKFLEPSKVQQRLYHGTMATEGGKRQEAVRRLKPSKEGALGSGVYLTPDSEFASTYAGFPARSQLERDIATGSDFAKESAKELLDRMNRGAVESHEIGGNILPVYAQLKNPLILEGKGDPMVEALVRLGMDEDKATRMVERAYENKGYIGKEVETRARAAGYDGLMQHRDGKLTEVVAYNPNAVKSAIGNQGTYDIAQPELSKAGGGKVKVLKTAKSAAADVPAREANLAKFLRPSIEKDRLYHGTTSADELTDIANQPISQFTTSPTWLAKEPTTANRYAGDKGAVYPVFAQIRNPLKMQFDADDRADKALALAARIGADVEYIKGMSKPIFAWEVINHPHFIEKARAAGFDGFAVNEGGQMTYGVFDPSKIKSATGNRGTFSTETPELSKAGGGSAKKGKAAVSTLAKLMDEPDLARRSMFGLKTDSPLADLSSPMQKFERDVQRVEKEAKRAGAAPQVTEKTVQVDPGAGRQRVTVKSLAETPISRRELMQTAGSQAMRRMLPGVDEMSVGMVGPQEMFAQAQDWPSVYRAMLPMVAKLAPQEVQTLPQRVGVTLEDLLRVSEEDPFIRSAPENIARFKELFPETFKRAFGKAEGGPVDASDLARMVTSATANGMGEPEAIQAFAPIFLK